MRRVAWAVLLLFALGGCQFSGPPGPKASTPVTRATKSPSPGSVQVAQAAPKTAVPGAQPQSIGSQVCVGCHKAAIEKFSKTLMGRGVLAPARPGVQKIECESCHGPASAHVAAGGGKGKGIVVTFRNGVETPKVQNERCLQCHLNDARRYWKGSQHQSRDVACVNCHKIMQGVSDRFALAKVNQNETCEQCHLVRRAQSFRNSHMSTRDGAIQCSNCHNPHGTPTEKLLKGNSVNETCYGCHPEKRGPFLWEHPPARENCANCHEPHGTLNDNLLKMRRPRLCNSCHVEGRHPSSAGLPNTIYTVNNSCQNCHSRIHGSNHPSGNFFER